MLLLSNCIKEAKSDKDDIYFFRGVMVNDYPPIFKLFKNSFLVEQAVLKFEVEITTSDGQNESNSNGIFAKIKCKPGIIYTIKWRLQGSPNWHSLVKEIPLADTLKINKNNVTFSMDKDELLINSLNSDENKTYFLSYFSKNSSYSTIGFLSEGGLVQRFFIEDPKKFLKLNSIQDGSLILWPPQNQDYYEWNKFKPCTKPFNWLPYIYTGVTYGDFDLFEMKTSDYLIFNQLERSKRNDEEPLFAGEPIDFDYKTNDMNGHVFTYYKFNGIRLGDFFTKNDSVTYEIHKNNTLIDTSKFTIKAVYFSILNAGGSSDAIEKSNKGLLFFNDYISSLYKYTNDLGCGNIKQSHDFNILIQYYDKILKKNLNYKSQTFNYNYQPLNCIVNIP